MEAVLGTATRSCFESFTRKDDGETYLRCFPHCSCENDTVICGSTFDVLWCIPDFDPETMFFFGEFVSMSNENETSSSSFILNSENSFAEFKSGLHEGHHSLFKGNIRRWLPLGNVANTVRVKVVFDEKSEWIFNPSSIHSKRNRLDKDDQDVIVANLQQKQESNLFKFRVFAIKAVTSNKDDNNNNNDNNNIVVDVSVNLNQISSHETTDLMQSNAIGIVNEPTGLTTAATHTLTTDLTSGSHCSSSMMKYIVVGEYFTDSFTVTPPVSSSSSSSSFCRRYLSNAVINLTNPDSHLLNSVTVNPECTNSSIIDPANSIYDKNDNNNSNNSNGNNNSNNCNDTNNSNNNNDSNNNDNNDNNFCSSNVNNDNNINSKTSDIMNDIRLLQLPTPIYRPTATHVEQAYLMYRKLKKRSYAETRATTASTGTTAVSEGNGNQQDDHDDCIKYDDDDDIVDNIRKYARME